MDIYAVANQMKMERKTIFDLNIRVTFYARVSSKRDEQLNSVENQIAFFKDMIEKNPNWEYVEGYVDTIRGEDAENRPEFLRMVEDGKSGNFDLIIAKEISRFARNTVDGLVYTRQLLRDGVGMYFHNDNICTIDTDSELRLTIMLSIATDEVRKLSERVKFGHKRAIEDGHVLGNNRIYGYQYDKCKLRILEEEAEMVRLIFDLYSTGNYSVKKIEDILYQKGYRSRAGTRIHHNTVSGILQNPKYKGYYCGNKVKIMDYRTKEQRFLPEEEWVMYKDESGDIVPAIVDEDLWNKCNEIFKERSNMVKMREHSFKTPSVFSGKIVCAVHKGSYWRTSYSNSTQKGNTVYQWICGTKRRFGSQKCSSFAIMENDLYSILSNCFQQISSVFSDNVDEFLKPFLDGSLNAKNKKRIYELENLISKEQDKKAKLLDLYTDEIISKAEFRERNALSTSRVVQYQIEINSLTASMEDDIIKKKISSIRSLVSSVCHCKEPLSNEQVDTLVVDLIDKILITPIYEDKMRIEILLKTGDAGFTDYSKRGHDKEFSFCRLGIIGKKMIESYEQNAK